MNEQAYNYVEQKKGHNFNTPQSLFLYENLIDKYNAAFARIFNWLERKRRKRM